MYDWKEHRIIPAVILAVILLMPENLFAGTGDFMRDIGKIYVVVSVIAVIFVGLATYLVYLNRKIKRLEKKLDDES